MSYEPTPTQALLLFGLLARHGECAQAELMPKVKPADLEALMSARLVGVEAKRLKLTDPGWAWLPVHLSAALPPAHRALSDLLMRLGDHLERTGETLANVIGSKPEDPAVAAKRAKEKVAEEKKQQAARQKQAKAEAAEEKKQRAALEKQAKAEAAEEKKQQAAREKQAKAEAKALEQDATKKASATKKAAPKKTPKVTPKRSSKATGETTAAALRQRIETAYLAITGNRKNQAVRLAQLRAGLADISRATLDSALAHILEGDTQGKQTASLMRHDDPQQLRQADHDAEYNPYGEPFHVLWISS